MTRRNIKDGQKRSRLTGKNKSFVGSYGRVSSGRSYGGGFDFFDDYEDYPTTGKVTFIDPTTGPPKFSSSNNFDTDLSELGVLTDMEKPEKTEKNIEDTFAAFFPDETEDTSGKNKGYKCRDSVPYLCGKETNQPGYCRRSEVDCNFIQWKNRSKRLNDNFIYQGKNDVLTYQVKNSFIGSKLATQYIWNANNKCKVYSSFNYSYNAQGSLLSQRDSFFNGDKVKTNTYSFTYNDKGLLSSKSGYDHNGKLFSLVNYRYKYFVKKD